MTNQPIKISENCWKHTNEYGSFYTKTSDPKSELHREDGPAFEYTDGEKHWYINGKLHRTDGPAIEYASGTKYWLYHDKPINVKSQEEFDLHLKNLIFI